MATCGLFLLISSKPGIAVFPLLIFLICDLKEGYFGFFKVKENIRKTLLIIVSTTLFITVFFSFLAIANNITEAETISKLPDLILRHLWNPFTLLNPMERFDYLLRGGTVKYGIDYFVMRKYFFAAQSSLPKIYENKHYVLLASK